MLFQWKWLGADIDKPNTRAFTRFLLSFDSSTLDSSLVCCLQMSHIKNMGWIEIWPRIFDNARRLYQQKQNKIIPHLCDTLSASHVTCYDRSTFFFWWIDRINKIRNIICSFTQAVPAVKVTRIFRFFFSFRHRLRLVLYSMHTILCTHNGCLNQSCFFFAATAATHYTVCLSDIW